MSVIGPRPALWNQDVLFIYLKRELKNNSAFTAFKRWLIKDHQEYFSEFLT